MMLHIPPVSGPPREPLPPLAPTPPDRPTGDSRPGRAMILLVGGLATVAMIGLGAYQMAGALAHEEHTEAVALAGPIRHVVVQVGTGSVTIRGGDRDDVRGARLVSRGLRTPTAHEHVEGDTLTIEGDCPGVANMWCRTSYDLEVPRGVSVDAHSGPGAITIEGVDGDVRARTIAGDVNLRDLGGSADVESSAGTLRGEGLRSPKVTASTTAGPVLLQFSSPPGAVSARTAAGQVDIELPHDDAGYKVDATTAAGARNVEVDTTPRSDRFIVATSAAGSVRVHYPD